MLSRISKALVIGAAALLLACGGSAATGDTDTTPTGGGADEETGGGEAGVGAGGAETGGIDTSPEMVEKGAEVYSESCAFCHGDDLSGSGDNPALVGADALSDYAGDQELLAYVAAEMPKDDPGALSEEEYTAVVAFLRSKNMQ